MQTLAEVEEALSHAARVPVDERGAAYWAFVDGLLEQRKELAGTPAQRRETRVVFSGEAR